MYFPIGLFLVLLISPVCWCQQPPTDLKARTLFYSENPDNDQLPPPSTTKPHKPKKTDISKRVTATSAVSTSGGAANESPKANSATAKVEGAPRPESSGSSAVPVVQHLALRYNVLLVNRNDNRIIETADPARNFHEGDCVALEFEPNRSGYLYVLEKGSSGAWKPLFPSADLPNQSNVVKAQTRVRVPESTCFTIVPPKGEERVFVILTRNPADVYQLQKSIQRENDGTTSPLLAQNMNRLSQDMEKRLASRDLEVETVPQPQSPGERPYSVYVANVSNAAFDELSVEIQIRHN